MRARRRRRVASTRTHKAFPSRTRTSYAGIRKRPRTEQSRTIVLVCNSVDIIVFSNSLVDQKKFITYVKKDFFSNALQNNRSFSNKGY